MSALTPPLSHLATTEHLSPPATASTPARSLTFGLLVIMGVWFVLFLVILQEADTAYRLIMLLAILTALTVPLAIQHVRQGLDLFEPLVFANLAMASMFLGRPLFDISDNHWYDRWFNTYLDVRPGFDFMLQVALIGVIGFQAGYLSGLPEKLAVLLPRFAVRLDSNRAAKVALWIFLLGFFLFALYVIQSGGIGFLVVYLTSRLSETSNYSYHTASGYLMIGPLFWPPAGVITFACWMKTGKRWQLYTTLVVVALFLATNFGTGARTFLIQGVVGLVVVWYIGRNKRPGIFLILPTVLIGLLISSYTREARTAVTFDDKAKIVDKMAADPGRAIISIWSEDDAAMVDYFSVMVANIPSKTPFGHFSTITDVLLRAYPRFLWPGGKKPDEHMVYLFKYFFPRNYYEYTTGASCSLVAELYDDFGTPAAFIGMFIFGVILGIPKPWFYASKRALPVLLFYVAMPAYTISLMRGGVPAFIEYLAITAVPGILLTRFAKAAPAAL